MKLYFSIFFFALGVFAKAQNYKYKYFLNESFESVPEKEAVLVGYGLFEDSLYRSFRLDGFNKKKIPVLSAHFTNSMLNVIDGEFTSYYPNGIMEQDGYFDSSYRDKEWDFWDDKGRKTDSMFFDKGNLLVRAKYTYYNSDTLSLYEMTDSLRDKYIYRSYYSNGTKSLEAIFSGNTGSLKRYDSTGTDSYLSLVGSRERTWASYPGGDTAWYSFMYYNLDHNAGIKHGVQPGIYRVLVGFLVDTDGTISDVRPLTKFGHNLEKEAKRFIESYPKWNPATFFGIPVKSAVMESILFLYQ